MFQRIDLIYNCTDFPPGNLFFRTSSRLSSSTLRPGRFQLVYLHRHYLRTAAIGEHFKAFFSGSDRKHEVMTTCRHSQKPQSKSDQQGYASLVDHLQPQQSSPAETGQCLLLSRECHRFALHFTPTSFAPARSTCSWMSNKSPAHP